jgi:polysaccharide biosynthesis protein PslG
MGPGTRRAQALAAVALTIALAATALAVLPATATPADLPSAGVAAQSTEPSPYAGRVGMNDHMVWYDTNTITATYQSLVAGGVTHVREDLPWPNLEPVNGQFDWGRTDNLMTAASRTGMEVLGILSYSPTWASSQGTSGQAFPRSDADFADFARQVARRYGPGGTFWSANPNLQPKPMRALEIWNEAFGYWNARPNPDPARYASLALAGAQAIEGVSSQIRIAIDGTLIQVRTDGQIRSWIEAVLTAQPTLKDHIDVYSLHPYPDPQGTSPMTERSDARWDFGAVELVRQATSRLGAARPIWITEVGWSTASQAPGTVSESTQSTYLTQAIRRSVDEWGSYVERIYLYSYDRDGSDPTEREGFFGVRHRDGTPKPAWRAIQDLLADRPASTPTTTAPPATTSTTTPTPAATTTTVPAAVLGPSRIAVRVFGSILYYDLA